MDENFLKEYRSIKNKALLETNRYFFDHIEEIAKSIGESLAAACDHIREIQQKGYGAVEYLEFTMLRTRLIRHDYQFPIMVYGSGWYADQGQLQAGEINGEPIFSFYEDMIQTLSKLVKKYQTKLPARYLLTCMCETAELFWEYAAMACQWAVMGFTPEGMNITEDFRIRACEYMGFGKVCWRRLPEMTNGQLKDWFDKREKDIYKYRDFRGRDFSGWNFSGLDLTSSDFSGCKLENCSFQGADLTGAWFCGSNMKGACLRKAWVPGARFDRADLREADLKSAYSTSRINRDLWMRPDNFAASFKRADLRGADFNFSAIDQADFTEALMEGVIFHESHKGYYHLDDQQKASARFGSME